MNWKECITQCSFEPTVERPLENIPVSIVACGMGGSGLAASALGFFDVPEHTTLHQDYGLPRHMPEDALCIAVSYSGATEETVSFANEALRAGRPLAIVASGGVLGELAHREQLPYVAVPPGYQPRYALVYLVRALLALLGKQQELDVLAAVLPDEASVREQAEQAAKSLVEHVPVLYASERNALLARMGKVIMNECAHLPAFVHTFPEMNHAELESYDRDIPEGLEHLFRPYIISDDGDDARILRRMDLFESVLGELGKTTMRSHFREASRARILIETWLTMLMTAEALAEVRGIDPTAPALVARFKSLL